MRHPDLTPIYRETRPYRRCARCLLDTIGPHEIAFDGEGVCNYCRDYERAAPSWDLSAEVKAQKLEAAIAEIKSAGRGRRYDCIMGLSGGVDSTYVAYLAMVHGLRPLIVHLDNSWNSELAVKNIEKVIERTGFDYYNHVVDWEEFKDLQLAYLKASVIDTEVVTDHAIFALLHIMADRLEIKHILFGDNPRTERMMPRGWGADKNDLANLRSIHREHGTKPLKTFPLMGLYEQVWYRTLKNIRYVSLLHCTENRVGHIKQAVAKEFGWREYRWKHCESVFTEFYQGYILPKKFAVDKRKAHLSSLLVSGEIDREAALQRLAEPYYEEDALPEAYDYVIRKFGLTADEFEAILAQPIVPHAHFPSDCVDWSWKVKFKLWRLRFIVSGLACRCADLIAGKQLCDKWRQHRLRKREENLHLVFPR
jgi:N-acetyl sugar amidotransferase